MLKLRKDFPYLNNSIIKYFDSAATSQKPQAVINAISDFYINYTAPVYRAIYDKSEFATIAYESARDLVAKFINSNSESIIFTSGTTESINFIANTWVLKNISKQDNIILTYQEHHSNILPWLELAKKTGCKINFVKLTSSGELDYEHYLSLLDSNTKLVACTHVSNVLGVENNIKFMVQAAKKVGVKFLLDAAQSIGHILIDVIDLDVDFLAFSGHKILGPTGIGILYIAKNIINSLVPYKFGGSMITGLDNNFNYTLSKIPQCFEAGTPPIAQAIGLAAAVKYYFDNINFQELNSHVKLLSQTLIDALLLMPKVKIVSPTNLSNSTGHIVSFVVENMHSHDVAAYLNNFNIAVRAGFHCSNPVHDYLKLKNGTVRVSFHCYNSLEEVLFLINILQVFK